jgi:hypothetical protein
MPKRLARATPKTSNDTADELWTVICEESRLVVKCQTVRARHGPFSVGFSSACVALLFVAMPRVMPDRLIMDSHHGPELQMGSNWGAADYPRVSALAWW